MKKIIFLLALLFSIGIVSAQLVDSPWPTFHADFKHTGVSKYPTSIDEPSIKWKFDAGNGIETSPAIGEDGTIYFGTFKNSFFALNPDGTMKWNFTREGEEFRSSPTLSSDGTIYFLALYKIRPVYNILYKVDMDYGVPKLYALNLDGTVKWEFEVGGIFGGTLPSPLIDKNGVIYVGAGSNDMTKDAKNGYRLVAVYPNGTEKWSFKTAKEIYSSAALADDGTIIFGCADGSVYALNPDGTQKWRFSESSGYFDSTPAIGSDGTVYISSTDQNFYAISSDGKEKWRFKMNEFLETNPSIGQDGTIYIGVLDKVVEDTNLYALNPNGTLKWKFKTEGGVYSTPAIDSNGIIYFGSYDQHVYSLNPDGSLRWKLKLGGPIVMSPSIDKEGTLYFGTWDHNLYAIDGIKRENQELKKETLINKGSTAICGNKICEEGEKDCHDDCGSDDNIDDSAKYAETEAKTKKGFFEKLIDFFRNIFK